MSLSIFCVDCRPQDPPAALINVEDTDDEFEIKRPDAITDAKDTTTYNDFIKELYRHDADKTTKAKRSAEANDGHGKLPVSPPEEFEIPPKPVAYADQHYDQFLTNLYRHDELKRSRRMIVFRHDILKAS